MIKKQNSKKIDFWNHYQSKRKKEFKKQIAKLNKNKNLKNKILNTILKTYATLWTYQLEIVSQKF